MISRNLKIKYRRSVLGILWTLLAPLAITLIYYFVFELILKINIPHYLAFLVSGVLFWSFFAQSLLEGMESIVGNWGLISKVPIPIQVFPYVGTLTNLVTLTLAFPILIGVVIFSGLPIGMPFIFIFFYQLCLFLLAYGFSFILAVGYVYFRDLRHLTGICIQIWFYSTPVIYDESKIPESYRWILYLNPVGQAFTGIHRIIIECQWPQFQQLSILLGWTLAVLLVATLLQKRFGREVVEHI